MKKAVLSLFLLLTINLTTKPPSKIPEELVTQFTENNTIPVWSFYIDGTMENNEGSYKWVCETINAYIKKALRKECNYYGATDLYLYDCLEKYLHQIDNKEVAVVGSLTPWYEAIVLSLNGRPTTIEYNKITCSDQRIKTYTPDEFAKINKKFDAVISISSIEHSGLGRYGDDLDPYGDYKAMDDFKNMLKPNGVLFLAVPVCKDSISFNAHRTYGKIRLPKLLDGWKNLYSRGFHKNNYNRNYRNFFWHQPVFVLQPE